MTSPPGEEVYGRHETRKFLVTETELLTILGEILGTRFRGSLVNEFSTACVYRGCGYGAGVV